MNVTVLATSSFCVHLKIKKSASLPWVLTMVYMGVLKCILGVKSGKSCASLEP